MPFNVIIFNWKIIFLQPCWLQTKRCIETDLRLLAFFILMKHPVFINTGKILLSLSISFIKKHMLICIKQLYKKNICETVAIISFHKSSLPFTRISCGEFINFMRAYLEFAVNSFLKETNTELNYLYNCLRCRKIKYKHAVIVKKCVSIELVLM